MSAGIKPSDSKCVWDSMASWWRNCTLTLVTYGRARIERLKTVANALGEIVLGEDNGREEKRA